MILKKDQIQAPNGRRAYELGDRQILVQHFVVRTTTPANPFVPHKHERAELWYIIDGTARVLLGDREHTVQEGDLIAIDPWVEHGLSTESQVTWICLG
jgi:mannose-6-phosphate isomerase-like protein (cupin superfamily)